MKIEYSHHIFSSQVIGGISNYFIDLATDICEESAQVEMNFPLTLTSALKNFSPFAGSVVPKRLIKRGVTWRLVNTINSSSAFLNRYSSREHDAPDIFHRTYYSESGNHRATPEVLTVFDMIHEDFPAFFKKPILDMKLSSIQKATAIICISEYTRDRLLALTNVDPAKVTVIPLGVRGSNSTVSKSRTSVGRPYIVYVGNRTGYKNFDVLAEAFSELIRTNKELDLYLVGGGPLTKEEQSLFDLLGIGSSLHLASSSTDVKQLVNLAQCVVSTSLTEGFGLVPLEALIQGTPCVLSDIEVNREIWRDTLPLFVPNDHLGLAAQIQHLLDSDEHWYSTSQRGLAVAKELSVERMAESTLQVYKTIVHNR